MIIILVFCAMMLAILVLTISLMRENKIRKQNLTEYNQLGEKLKRKEHLIMDIYQSNRILENQLRTIQAKINNPFNEIISMADVLIEDFDFYSNEDKLLYLREFKESADKTFNYIQNLFVWLNYNHSKNEMKIEKVDITKTIHENIQKLVHTADRKQVTIETDLDPKLVAHTNKDVVSTVVRNLLHNALTYTQKPGLVFVTAFGTADMIKLIIEDNGKGIPEHKQKSIYNRWENGRKSFEEPANENGLGLILSKELLNRIHGELWFETSSDVGSKFTVTLPR